MSTVNSASSFPLLVKKHRMSHADRPDPETVILENGDLAATAEQVLDALTALGIEHQTTTHEPL